VYGNWRLFEHLSVNEVRLLRLKTMMNFEIVTNKVEMPNEFIFFELDYPK
jgi:hypothetical protein